MTDITARCEHDDRTVDRIAEQLPIRQGGARRARLTAAVFLIAAAGCASVPGETVASASERRDVTAKLIASATQGHAACKRVKVVDTQVLEVQGDGKVAVERWVVDRCDERLNYRVTYPAKGQRTAIQIKAE